MWACIENARSWHMCTWVLIGRAMDALASCNMTLLPFAHALHVRAYCFRSRGGNVQGPSSSSSSSKFTAYSLALQGTMNAPSTPFKTASISSEFFTLCLHFMHYHRA
eukprot:16810-Pelagomonas_calceolata.AAC.3